MDFVAQQSKKRPSATAQLVMRAAEQSRQEVASGAASVRFFLMVTATVLHGGVVAALLWPGGQDRESLTSTAGTNGPV